MVETLREMLRPGLRAIFVGLNPSPVSVQARHYYQGHLGRMFWRRLQAYGLTTELPAGREDEAAFEPGYGFADLVRRPTARAGDLARREIRASVPDLIRRIGSTGELSRAVQMGVAS
jgi:TDG/mug DNA glycosylase family protein